MTLRRFILAAVCLLTVVTALPADPGDNPGEPVAIVAFRTLLLPVDASLDDALQLQLYVSADKGRTWDLASSVAPAKGGFLFTAPRDGQYWFILRTIGFDGTVEPANVSEAMVDVKVRVASARPVEKK